MAGSKRRVGALLEDGESEEEGDGTLLRVNEEFARRFEHNKRREELHRLQEKHGKEAALGSEEETDSEDDEEENEDGFAPQKTEEQFIETLVRIKKRDPSIYDAGKTFYSDVDTEEEEEEHLLSLGGRKEKPVYIKDMVTKQLLERAEGIDVEEDGSDRPQVRTHQQEQDDVRAAFLHAARELDSDEEGDEFGGGLLKKKKKTEAELKKEAEEDAAFAAEKSEKEKLQKQRMMLEEYFGKEEELDENDRFLKSYILNKGWIDKEEDYRKEMEGLSEDEDNVEKAEEFEYNYQHRYQEEGAERIITHPRTIEESVRKEESSRKRKRKDREERKKAEAQAHLEEIKRLKNLKKMEMQEKLQQIRDIAGYKGKALDKLKHGVLEEDFDPERHDHSMQQIFNEEYYEEEDDDETLKKPEFEDIEEELERMVQGRGKLRKKSKKRSKGSHDTSEGVESKDLDDIDIERKKAEINRAMEEYYNLDAEDTIDGVRTRFKYKSVAPAYFGLDAGDILAMDDKELNQIISLKKLAPYREESDSASRHKKIKLRSEPERNPKERYNHAKEKAHASGQGETFERSGLDSRLASYEVPKAFKKRKEKSKIG